MFASIESKDESMAEQGSSHGSELNRHKLQNMQVFFFESVYLLAPYTLACGSRKVAAKINPWHGQISLENRCSLICKYLQMVSQ